MDLKRAIGYDQEGRTPVLENSFLHEYVNLKLAATGLPCSENRDYPFMELAHPLLVNYQEQKRLLSGHLCPVDQRIQDYLDATLEGVDGPRPRLPGQTLVLDCHGMSRILSLPSNADRFESDIVKSYRIRQGVLHNPKHDRRTTKGSFHVVEGGLPIAADKIAVPKQAFAHMLQCALTPPQELKLLPYTSGQEKKAYGWVSILLRPMVCPEIPGVSGRKTMEVRFFAPGNLVSNLDFVETIFGNAGDPGLPENDAALDSDSWTGHTGCVILAPQLTTLRKKDIGLPHLSEATERQKRDGIYYEQDDELYNGGNAFKVTCRDTNGVVVTLIADNYFGYCKKEVKTQLSYATNLHGSAEEEHAGGAIAFPSYDLGEDFLLTERLKGYMRFDHSFAEVCERYGDNLDIQPEGYAIDKTYPDIYYVPEHAYFTLHDQRVIWEHEGKASSLRLQPDVTYLLPSGYKVEMVKPREGRRWRLVGTTAEGTYCHKPCTVSGGGKSEISKEISDAILSGPVILADFQRDFDEVEKILNHDFGNRFSDASMRKQAGRPILSHERSIGSVVKLLTPHESYTDEYNAWIRSIPHHIKELVFVVKRFYKPDWGDDWRERFHVDIVDGSTGYELKYRKMKLLTHYLRLGYTEDGSWRTFGLRKDFFPASKLQLEDDITASTVIAADKIEGLNPSYKQPSVKFAVNCEYRLFQRPDEAIHPGYDKATEADLAKPANFLSNFEPLDRDQVREIVEDTIGFEKYTEPVQKLLQDFLEDDKHSYCVCPSQPRLVDGKPTKNPRYLQDRTDLNAGRAYYLAKTGTRLYRKIALEKPVPQPVNAVLPGRRNNPPEGEIRPLCVFNPIHYLPLPELFMEYTSSMTGKSPSTTGAGSEGALTKGPFNMLRPIHDLNNTLVSYIITGSPAFITAAGYVGPHYRVDHDISLIVPEVWSRMHVDERDPEFLIKNGMLEAIEDFEFEGRTIPASLLGYRITSDFVTSYFGRIFGNPAAVFPEAMLRPEQQNLQVFVDGMDNIMATHDKVGKLYFEDGSVEQACPPLKALLHIMAKGDYEGKTIKDPEIRKLFTLENLLASDWYAERLSAKQGRDKRHAQRQLDDIERALTHYGESAGVANLDLLARKQALEERLKTIQTDAYLESLRGTLGVDPSLHAED